MKKIKSIIYNKKIMDIVRTAFFIGLILLLFPVSYALQTTGVAGSVSDPRSQTLAPLQEFVRTVMDTTRSIAGFVSALPRMISITINILSRLAAGELEYADVAWCFDIIRLFADELGLSRTYGAFTTAVLALATGGLTVDDIYEILRVLPHLIREAPGAIARILSMAYDLGFEVVFAPIVGGALGLVMGAVLGAAIFIGATLFFPALAIILCLFVAVILVVLAVVVFVAFDVLLFVVSVVFIILAVIVGVIAGAVLGALIGGGAVLALFLCIECIIILIFIVGILFGWIIIVWWTLFGLILWLVLTLICAIVGAVVFALFFGAVAVILSLIAFVIVIVVELFLLFVVLPGIVISIFVPLLIFGLVLALCVGLPIGLCVGLGVACIFPPVLWILLTCGYPLMRWADLTGAIRLGV